MADQLRWFKLWYSAGSDDALCALSPALRWAWAILGAHTTVHGTRGRVEINAMNTALAGAMGVTVDDMTHVIKSLPHLHVEEGKNGHGWLTVTWHNWPQYQSDTTQTMRQRLSRSKRRGEEKRKEEMRGEDPHPLPPPQGVERDRAPDLKVSTPQTEPRKTASQDNPDPPAPASREAGEPPGRPPSRHCEDCRAILDEVNKFKGTRYRAGGPAGRFMHARHLEHGIEACLDVVRHRREHCRTEADWKYFRPSTIFRPENFENAMEEARRSPPKWEPPEVRGPKGATDGLAGWFNPEAKNYMGKKTS